MRVSFSSDVLAAPERYGRDLNAIAERLELGQHEWDIDDLDALKASRWICERPGWDSSSLGEFASKSYRASVDAPKRPTPPRLVLVMTAASSDSGRTLRCTPAQARQVLTSALRLVLENATSDGAFVRSIAATWDRRLITTAIERGWLVFEHAGGSGEFVKRVAALLGQQVHPVRLLCLMDSDRLVRGPLPMATEARCKQLKTLGVESFVLHKREVENYLPTSKLDGNRTRSVYVSWLTLSGEQRDYFDMKLGFKKDHSTAKAKVPSEQHALFAGVSEWHLTRLIGGFGGAIGERFDGSALDSTELEDRCATEPGELGRLLEWLEDAL